MIDVSEAFRVFLSLYGKLEESGTASLGEFLRRFNEFRSDFKLNVVRTIKKHRKKEIPGLHS